MERKKVGEVFHFFGKIGVAAIRLTDGAIAIGDTIQILGPTTNLEQIVDTLQIEHAAVETANQGQEVGMKVPDRVREKDFVYKIIQTEATVQPKPAPKPKAKAPKAKGKAPKKKSKAPKAKKAVKKASRAPRSKARRGSRKSRSR